MKTPQQANANWTGASGRAGTAWQEGVQNFNGDWAGRTVAQQSVMQNNWQQAVSSGRWASGVTNTGNTGWKQATVSKAGNYTTGYSAGSAKQLSAITKILNAEANIVGSLPPRGDFAANVQRSVSVQTALHALKGQLGA